MSHNTGRLKRRSGGGHEEEHVSHERWLVTYADMLTLLMVLFIVMFAMSQVDATKFALLKEGLAMGFGGTATSMVVESGPVASGGAADSQVASLDPGVSDLGLPAKGAKSSQGDQSPQSPSKQAMAAAARAQAEQQASDAAKQVDQYQKIKQQINDALSKAGIKDGVVYHVDQRGLVISVLTSSIVFAGDRADLLSGGQHILDTLIPTLRSLPNNIEVDGHTNQLPTPTLYYPSAWELSTARASTVVRYMIAQGFSADRLSAAGFAGTRPLYPPSSPKAVTGNRRVDIVVLSSLSSDTRALVARISG